MKDTCVFGKKSSHPALSGRAQVTTNATIPIQEARRLPLYGTQSTMRSNPYQQAWFPRASARNPASTTCQKPTRYGFGSSLSLSLCSLSGWPVRIGRIIITNRPIRCVPIHRLRSSANDNPLHDPTARRHPLERCGIHHTKIENKSNRPFFCML